MVLPWVINHSQFMTKAVIMLFVFLVIGGGLVGFSPLSSIPFDGGWK